MIIDATDCILGRLASYAAKQSLLGEKIDIVNCEQAVISGSSKDVLENYKEELARGQPQQGPFLQRRPDKFIRLTIRGMLPYKQEKGLLAYKRIMCHIGIPDEFKGKKMEKVKGAEVLKLPNLKYIRLDRLCKALGWKA